MPTTFESGSADGRSIAFVRDCAGNSEIQVVHADGAGLTRLTTTPGTEHSPAWPPDGMRLAYAYDPGDGERTARDAMRYER